MSLKRKVGCKPVRKKTVLCRSCRKRFVPEDRRRRKHDCPHCGNAMGKRETISQLKKEAWKAFACYIKLRDSYPDDRGQRVVACVTCGEIFSWNDSKIHAGHFLDGRRKGIIFDERCTHAQCAKCNLFMNGNKDAYWPFMLARYGMRIIDRLLEQKHQGDGVWTPEDLRGVAETYRSKARELANKLGVIAGI